MKNACIELYQAINSDYSLKRYTLGWKELTTMIRARYTKTVDEAVWDNYAYFSDDLVHRAHGESTGKLKEAIEKFARELSINMETLREKRRG